MSDYKFFRLMTSSKNANSFGLRGCILVAPDGEAWEVGSNALNLPKKNELFKVELLAHGPDFAAFGWEIPHRLPRCPKTLADRFWRAGE